MEKIAKLINDVTENQIKPYVIIEWKKGKSAQTSFGEFFANAIVDKWKEL